AAERGGFAGAEGNVLSVRESAGTIYMNFGRRWSQALTVTISKRDERVFAAAGVEPKKLENRRVRVRGWVEERNGPRIEVTRPEQLQTAERNGRNAKTRHRGRRSETPQHSQPRTLGAGLRPRFRPPARGLQLVAAFDRRAARLAARGAAAGPAATTTAGPNLARASAHSRRL